FFSYGDERMLPIYYKKGGLGLWHVLSRLSYKAEILVGTGQLIAEVLGTTAIPQVRDSIAELSMYATALKAYVMAAEDSAELQNGVLIPNERFITAGRLHSITEYPRMMQILRDMSGQGLISRFSSKAFNEATIKDMMHEFLPGTGVSATDKNRLFNFVWDLTSGSAAMRVALFENVNSTPPSALRARIYGSGHHKPWRDIVAERLNLQFDS